MISLFDVKPDDVLSDPDAGRWMVLFFNPPGHSDNDGHPNGKLSLVGVEDPERTMLFYGTQLPDGWSVVPS